MKEIIEKCKTCKRYKKTSPRPLVGMTMASNFNKQIQMDMGEMDGEVFQ